MSFAVGSHRSGCMLYPVHPLPQQCVDEVWAQLKDSSGGSPDLSTAAAVRFTERQHRAFEVRSAVRKQRAGFETGETGKTGERRAKPSTGVHCAKFADTIETLSSALG